MHALSPELDGDATTAERRSPPNIGRAVRDAASDFYFNSWRVVPANVVFGALLALLLLGAVRWPPLLLAVGILAIPLAGLHRMAALACRGRAVSFGDFIGSMRELAGPALGLGSISAVLAVVFSVNLVTGGNLGGPLGWILSVLSLYGLAVLAMGSVAAWPIVADVEGPAGLRARLRLALYVILVRPGPMLALTLLLATFLAVSTALVAPLLSVSVAFYSLVATRYVLPLADRVRQRESAQ